MAKSKIPDKFQVWIDARKRHRLSDAEVQMARELGMNPKKLGGMDNHRQEPWKMPLPEFIGYLYEKRFRKVRPETILSIEELVKQDQKKRAEKTERKRQKRLELEQPKSSRSDTESGPTG